MARVLCMSRGMAIERVVAATDVTALEADAQVNPFVTGLLAIFAANGARGHPPRFIEVVAFGFHWLKASVARKYRACCKIRVKHQETERQLFPESQRSVFKNGCKSRADLKLAGSNPCLFPTVLATEMSDFFDI